MSFWWNAVCYTSYIGIYSLPQSFTHIRLDTIGFGRSSFSCVNNFGRKNKPKGRKKFQLYPKGFWCTCLVDANDWDGNSKVLAEKFWIQIDTYRIRNRFILIDAVQMIFKAIQTCQRFHRDLLEQSRDNNHFVSKAAYPNLKSFTSSSSRTSAVLFGQNDTTRFLIWGNQQKNRDTWTWTDLSWHCPRDAN